VKRIYHTWEKWECYPAGFYDPRPRDVMTDDEAREAYRAFLADLPAFSEALMRVLAEWPKSCEHYLSNESMNRIAWLGQASMCIAHGIPAKYRGGFNMLTDEQQHAANLVALGALNMWLHERGEEMHTLETAVSKTEANLY
jgi:hypothetical protein